MEMSTSWCYGNDDTNCDKYGRLYDWEMALTVCPDGWKLPDTADWNKLEATAVGSLHIGFAGAKLKSRSGWYENEWSYGTDKFGFSATGGGYRSYDKFRDLDSSNSWWTTTEAHYRRMHARTNDVMRVELGSKANGFSVRCLKAD